MIRVLSFLFIMTFAGVAFGGSDGDINQCAELDPPVDVLDDAVEVTNVMNVADSLTIDDVNVTVDYTVEWQGEITIDVESPAATSVTLHDQTGSSGASLGISTTFDDEATVTTTESAGDVQPVGSLSDFDGETSDGDWTLGIIDNTIGGSFAGDGTLDDWCLEILDCDLVAPSDFTCEIVENEKLPNDVALSWTNDENNYDSIDVLRNGVLLSAEAGDATSYTDVDPGSGAFTYTLVVTGEGGSCNFEVTCNVAPGYDACNFDGLALVGDVVETDILNVPDIIFIGSCEALVDANLTFENEWDVFLTSPDDIEVQLHDQTSSSDTSEDAIRLVYSDDGVDYGTDALNCECKQKPEGPGEMADFADSFADGDWELSFDNQSFEDGGNLNVWCLSFVAQCPVTAPTGLECSGDDESDDITISWVNEQEYDTITISRDGEEVGSIDGDETSFVDQNVPGGVYTYTVTGATEADGCGRESEECVTSRGFAAICSGPVELTEGDNSDTLSVSAASIPDTVTALAISIDATDTNISDLIIDVTSAAGTSVSLFSDLAAVGTSIDVIYSDGGVANDGSSYDCACELEAIGSVDSILGDAFLNGFWSLSVSNAVGDKGDEITEWCVLFGEEVPQRGFKRGDVDANNTVVALIDGIALLDFGFNDGPAPICNDAADVDGNNSVNVLVDTLALLNWAYNGEAEPPAPGPFFCGLDNDVEFDADCDTEICAP